MKLSKIQEKIVHSTEKNIVVIAAAASGKALLNGSLLYTDNGPIKIEDATAGTKIYGEDGELHSIMGVYPQGKKEKYRVVFSDRSEVICCKDHLWTFQTESLRSHRSKTFITCSLEELVEKYPLSKEARAKNNFSEASCKRKNIFIPMTKPVQFSKKELPLKPYTMGALLGDGALRGAGEQSRFSNEDEDVLLKVKEELCFINCGLRHIQKYDYAITQQGAGQKGSFTEILEELSLDFTKSETKFIPNIYKYSSVDDRLELLKGLIDTDGHCRGSSYEITLKSKQLILDIKEVCESLGLTAVYSEKEAVCYNSPEGIKNCGTVYRLRLKTSKEIQKIHFSERREKQWKPTNVYSHRAIVEIVPLEEEGEMTCIQVDSPSKLFLTSGFIATHNTTVLTERVKWLLEQGANPNKIVVFTFTNAAAEEMRARIGEAGRDVFINTIHSYAFNLLVQNNISVGAAIDEENFDDFFHLIEANPQCIKEVDYLLLDEAQDSNLLQYKFILNMVKAKNLFVVGDFRQSIYEFNGGRPDLLLELSERVGYTTYDLNENYRNGPTILEFAKRIIRGTVIGDYNLLDNSVCMNEFSADKVVEVKFVAADIIKRIKEEGEYKDWFILARSNAQVNTISGMLEKGNIPCDTFKRSRISSDEFRQKMLDNTVKVLTVHSAKGLEADNVVVVGVSGWSKRGEERRIAYVAATRARKQLIWTKEFNKKPKISRWE